MTLVKGIGGLRFVFYKIQLLIICVFCKIHVPLCVIKILKNGKVIQTTR